MSTRLFSIEINGISLSVSAVDSLLKRLDELEKKLNGLGGNVDLGTMRGDLQSIRTQLQSNVDEWDNISDRIEDATNSVVQLERAYDRIDNPFKTNDIKDYSKQVKDLSDNLSDVSKEANKIDGLGDFNLDVLRATNSVDKLTDSLRSAKSAEDLLGTKLTVNVGGMALLFDDVNQGIGILEDKLYQLSATGLRDTLMFREITAEIANLKMLVTLVDDAVDNAFSGGLNRLISGVSSIASLASVGEGIGLLFGLQDNALDESIQKFAALSLVLQGVAELLQLLANKTSLASQAFKVLNSIATPTISGLGKLLNAISFGAFDKAGQAINNFNKTLKAADLMNLMEEFRKAAMLEEYSDAHSGWTTLLNDLEKVKKGLSEEIKFGSLQDLAEQFADVSMIAKLLRDDLEYGFIDQEQYDLATQALDKFKNGLSSDAVEAGKLKEELKGLGVYFFGLPPALTKTLKAMMLITTGIKAIGVAFKGLLKSTIILGLLLVAMESISWILEKVGKLWTSWAGDDTLVDQLDTLRAALDATKKSVEDYNKELEKLASEKSISTYTRLTEGVKEYEKALNLLIKTQQAFNAARGEGSKPLADNLDTNDTYWTGADIKNVEDFAKLFDILQKAVQAGTDRFKALKDESKEVQELFGGNWFQELWNTASDARADLSKAEKAVISDIQYRINNIDLSKGIDEVKKFIDVLDTPMYQISLANIEKLFPENEYVKVFLANLQLIRDYYNLISLMLAQAELEALKTRDLIGKNNIAAIRNRFTRERAELNNNEKLELRDAADNEELKLSIRNKYATLRAAMLRSQGNEIRNIQNLIDNNRIAAMQEGLKKQLAALNQQKEQEILAARDSEIKVGEQIAAINAKYDKLIFDAKKEFYTNKKKLLDDYAEYARQVEVEINNIELLLDSKQISDSYKKRIEQLGFGQETILNIRKFYNDVRDLSNEEAKKLLEKNKKISEINTQDQIDRENKLYDERNAQLYQQAMQGVYTQEEYDRILASEQVSHLNKIYSIMQKGNLDLIDLDNQYWDTIKNNNATAINERINALNEMYSDIKPQVKTNSLGIIDYKSTRAELKTAKDEYSNIFQEIAVERENLDKQFANKEITFLDYRAAKKDLDNLEKDVEQSTKDIGLQLDLLITLTVLSITQYVSQYVNVLGDLWSTYNEILMMKIDQEQARLEEEYDMLEEAYKKQEELTKKHTDKLNDIEDELKTSRGDRRAHLIEQLNMERAAMLESLQQEQKIQAEKDANLKKLDALEKKRREQEKKNSIVQATINTFTAVTNALAVQPWFVGLALSAVALAMGMAQVAQIKKQKYAKGGLLKGASHKNGGIPVGLTGIEVEGNEYVVNKKSTEKNLPLIDYINSSNKRLTKDDLIRFYDSGKLNVNRTAKSKFANGGILPNINMPTSLNEIVITDDRPVVVQVVDIVNKADNYRQVLVLAGLEGSSSI